MWFKYFHYCWWMKNRNIRTTIFLIDVHIDKLTVVIKMHLIKIVSSIFKSNMHNLNKQTKNFELFATIIIVFNRIYSYFSKTENDGAKNNSTTICCMAMPMELLFVS